MSKEPNRRRPSVRGKVDARGVPKKKQKLGNIGEPGRYKVLGSGMKCGVHHFSC